MFGIGIHVWKRLVFFHGAIVTERQAAGCERARALRPCAEITSGTTAQTDDSIHTPKLVLISPVALPNRSPEKR